MSAYYFGPATRGDTPGVWDGAAERFTALPADMADEHCPQCYAGITHTVRVARMFHGPSTP